LRTPPSNRQNQSHETRNQDNLNPEKRSINPSIAKLDNHAEIRSWAKSFYQNSITLAVRLRALRLSLDCFKIKAANLREDAYKVRPIRDQNCSHDSRPIDTVKVVHEVQEPTPEMSFKRANSKAAGKREGPWMMSKELLMMDGTKSFEEIDFSYIPIWVRIPNLPHGMMNRVAGETIGGEIGEFMEVVLEGNNLKMGR
ncbi:hypothetical protein BAE44_0001323, partial [Dichanthelium oligosanthes]